MALTLLFFPLPLSWQPYPLYYSLSVAQPCEPLKQTYASKAQNRKSGSQRLASSPFQSQQVFQQLHKLSGELFPLFQKGGRYISHAPDVQSEEQPFSLSLFLPLSLLNFNRTFSPPACLVQKQLHQLASIQTMFPLTKVLNVPRIQSSITSSLARCGVTLLTFSVYFSFTKSYSMESLAHPYRFLFRRFMIT